MLTEIDSELFPDDCEVVEIPSRDLWIYLIQKNGSSTLREITKKENHAILRNEAIGSLSAIDIFLRDPQERYLSGVNTYVQHILRDHPELDIDTCTFMATRYLFLNRHYLPQWHWIINLFRFITPDCAIRLHALEEMGAFTLLRKLPKDIKPYDPVWAEKILQQRDKLEFWFLLDRILLGYIGQSFTKRDLLKIYRDHPAKPLDLMFEKSVSLFDVLRTS